MSIPFPSHDWVKAFQDKLNTSASYANIARTWEGDLLFQVEMPNGQSLRLYLDLWHGQCRDAFEAKDPNQPAAFRLTAPLANFVKVLKCELDPMQAMMTGKLKVQGNMVMLMKNIPTVLEFVKVARTVETDFPAIN